MKTYRYKGKIYPQYLKEWNACEHITPIAKKFCVGHGLDVGGTPEWNLPGSIIVNPAFNQWSSMNLPPGRWDYIFSSHCLEHVEHYVKTLRYWISKIKNGGQIFLYLPHPEMEYWLPQNCVKHVHTFFPHHIEKLLTDLGVKDLFVSERDLYWSFAATGRV